MRFASWNVSLGARGRAKIELLRGLGCDLVALQEVQRSGFELLRQELIGPHRTFAYGWHSLQLRPAKEGEGGWRALGCAILATDQYSPMGGPSLVAGCPAPERSLTIELEGHAGPITVASFHFVAGSGKKWGPEAKRQNFEAVSGWLAKTPQRTIVGLDCNSPRVDHPDVSRNEYWGVTRRGDTRQEYLLHDPQRAPHVLRDAYRVYLASNPSELERVTRANPDGPLAVSHIKGPNVRRYDFIYVTPDIDPRHVEYRLEESRVARADHAVVLADLALD